MKKGIDFTGIAVVPFVHDGKGNYVVGLRTENCRDEHYCWEPTGGGGLEVGETTESAVIREVREELGAVPFNVEYLGHSEVFREHEGKQTHRICFDYKAQVKSKDVKIMEPDMCAELHWCAPDSIPKPMMSQFPAFLEKYKHKL